MQPIVNERGERLVAIHAIDERATTVRLSFALVVARLGTQVLLVHNRVKGVWELPGGWIGAGESAAECAVRELWEESGQVAVDLCWCARLDLVPASGTHEPGMFHGALYCADLMRATTFTPSDEIDVIGFWTAATLPANVSAIDAALLGFAERSNSENNKREAAKLPSTGGAC